MVCLPVNLAIIAMFVFGLTMLLAPFVYQILAVMVFQIVVGKVVTPILIISKVAQFLWDCKMRRP